jgi:excisionase family DNA binding protein
VDTEESDRSEDPWMTLAEFAEELRVRPVTVRSWIAKGQLKATRGGRRKWLVRRSELDRMLSQDETSAPALPPAEWPDAVPPEVRAEMDREGAAMAAEDERAERELSDAVASYEWDIALELSEMAPPDARFPSRIRQIAQAASRWSAVIRDSMNEPTFSWTPGPDRRGVPLSHELRPGGNRPGPKDAWDRFDRVVTRLREAEQGSSAGVVATALRDLAGAMNEIADAIEKRATSRLPRADNAEGEGTETKDGDAD